MSSNFPVKVCRQPTEWPDDRTAMLRVLWAEGLSSRIIAAKIGHGLTRNAVIGKAHRIGLPARTASHALANYYAARPKKVKPIRVPRVPKVVKAKAPKVNLSRPLYGPPTPPPSIEGAKVLTVRAFGRECAWPVAGEGADTLMCCAPVAGKSSYCLFHKRLGSAAGQPKALNYHSDHRAMQSGSPTWSEAA